MEAKELAKMFGGFSTERRVTIVTALMEAGKNGMSLIELSRKTELSVIDIGIAAEALLMMGLLDISVKGENKMLSANYKMLGSLFEEAHQRLGPGRIKVAAAKAAAEAEAAAAALAAAKAEAEAAAQAEAAAKAEAAAENEAAEATTAIEPAVETSKTDQPAA
jgi:hypothetical protein